MDDAFRIVPDPGSPKLIASLTDIKILMRYKGFHPAPVSTDCYFQSAARLAAALAAPECLAISGSPPSGLSDRGCPCGISPFVACAVSHARGSSISPPRLKKSAVELGLTKSQQRTVI